jgi:hypothetical protein
MRALGLRLILGFILPVGAVHAQRRDSVQIPLPGARTIVGFVADTDDRPLENAEVYITSLKRTTASGPDGSFRFDDVKPGKYQVGVRKIGYYPQGRSVTVGDQGGATAFWIGPTGPVTLPSVVSSAVRGGLSGVVGDTAFNAIPAAQIWVLASDQRTRSDSTGAFFLDLKPGRHMVRVERAGYGSKLLSVTIPRDSGRRVMVWLTETTRGARARESQAIAEFSMRLTRRNPVWSTLYTREDIARSRKQLLSELVNAGNGRPVDPNLCTATIDGVYREPLWAIDAADIETVEIYTPRPARGGVRSINAAGTRARPQPQASLCPGVFVWLRK